MIESSKNPPLDFKNLVLIGMMGAGKTSVGQETARQVDLPFIDTDAYIQAQSGLNVEEIFRSFGEAGFRKLEREAVCLLSQQRHRVIACGGGVVLDPQNTQKLRQNGYVVYLQTSAQSLYRRLEKDQSRPLLQGEDRLGKLQELLAKRHTIYLEAADAVIDTQHKSVEQISLEILREHWHTPYAAKKRKERR